MTTVVKERRRIFADHRTASLLQEIFDTCRRRYQFLLLSHVIMPDHVHAIIVPG
ncbi:MAG: transposase [Chloroflexi bacterium]|nr:transposase [Chloroflexota bacterium]